MTQRCIEKCKVGTFKNNQYNLLYKQTKEKSYCYLNTGRKKATEKIPQTNMIKNS